MRRTDAAAHRAAQVVAALALAALALTGCLAGCGSSPSPGFAGYEWQVVAISHAGKTTGIPGTMRVSLRFAADGRFGANDGVNFYSGSYSTTSGSSFTTSSVSGTLMGYAGHDSRVLLAIGAIQSFSDGVHATYQLTGDRLVVTVGGYTLTTQRGAPY